MHSHCFVSFFILFIRFLFELVVPLHRPINLTASTVNSFEECVHPTNNTRTHWLSLTSYIHTNTHRPIHVPRFTCIYAQNDHRNANFKQKKKWKNIFLHFFHQQNRLNSKTIQSIRMRENKHLAKWNEVITE